MFEWPIATPIDLETYPHRQWLEHFSRFDVPVTNRTLQIDVTNLKDYCKRNNLKFSLTIAFILTRASNHVPEFRHRIQDEIAVNFSKVIPSLTVLTENKIFAFMHGVYTDNFTSDYQENLEIQERLVKGLDKPVRSLNQGEVFITINPWTTQTAVHAPYTKQFASVPVFCVGKMYDDNGRVKLGLGLQVHHGFVDGYHIGHFVHIIERHLEDPTLVEHPFVSTFE